MDNLNNKYFILSIGVFYEKAVICPDFPFLFVSLFAQEWENPADRKVMTVFYQGMNSSQTQASKYTGSKGFISPTTGEHISCDNAINIVQNIWVKPEIDEVIPAPTARNWKQIIWSPTSLMGNLWQCTHETVSRLAHRMYGIKVKNMTGEQQAQTVAAHSLIVSKINVAQDGDLANHEKRVSSFYQEQPNADAIFMGVSRGAATTFQAAARYNKDNQKHLSAVKLIHLEGCFDSVEHTMKERHPWLLKYDMCLNALSKVASKVIAFKKEGTAPIKVVEDFPRHIPVAFITSKKDREVPAVCTKNLVKKLVQAGHKNVYLLELQNSSHPRYMMDDENDKNTYQNFMHALYKKLNLPYIPEYANGGKDLVESAQLLAQLLKE